MRKAFTLIELLVVIAILAVLAVVVVLTLNPAGLLQESRDSSRISDMATLNAAIGDFEADSVSSVGIGSSSVIYVSIPDATATSTAGDQCQGLGLPSLLTIYSYHCANAANYRSTNGAGWIPINLNGTTFGAPFSELPIDPTNNSSSHLYYTYTTNGQQFEITAAMESAKYKIGGTSDMISGDGGSLATVYEKGSTLGLEPLDYGDASLTGYWTFDEGTGTVTYDWSGNNATGNWTGTPAGTSGHYSAGKIGPWAGTFDGSTNYASYPILSNGLTTTAHPITIAAWVYLTSCANYPMVVSFGTNMELRTFFSSCRPEFIDGGNTATSLTAISTSSWHYLTGVSNGIAGYMYIDGVLQATSSWGSNVIGAFQIGSRSGLYYFPGLIDDVRIYNRALSATEIAAMYNGGK